MSLDVLQVLDALDDLGDMVGGGGETGRERCCQRGVERGGEVVEVHVEYGFHGVDVEVDEALEETVDAVVMQLRSERLEDAAHGRGLLADVALVVADAWGDAWIESVGAAG